MKMVAISMSSECIKDPPCSFCYQKDQKMEYERYTFDTYNKIRKLIDEGKWKGEEVTFCFEYNGYNLSKIEDYWLYSYRCEAGRPGPKPHFTMTTMHWLITPNLIGYIKNNSPIEALALSYDIEKVPNFQMEDYLEKVKMLKEENLRVSCNYLLLPPYTLPKKSIMEEVDQLNLLSLKPPGKLLPKVLEVLGNFITLGNSIVPVTVDNCLGVQLGKVSSCMRGKDFLHILPDGNIVGCCFQEKCHLYKT